jgi:hypothetical protein
MMKYDDIVRELRSLRAGVKDLQVQMQKVRVFSRGFFGQPPFLVFLSVAEQRTFRVLRSLMKPARAEEVAAITGRARAVESLYLNGLYRRGLVLKERRARIVFFVLKEDYKNGST